MARITIALDEETARLLSQHAKSSGQSTSKWVADAIRQRMAREWPADVLSLFGTWKNHDFPDATALRRVSGSGSDVRREKL